ncbi:MFS transporter [Brevibacterium otitidis]|uniref:MFS transporter n=1 Tax=Brevibacterium otitidis TaxID=53364 RepID=A0ABV5WZU8_9MICO|nr:MFS transporter [Brevibacterium otitidis]
MAGRRGPSLPRSTVVRYALGSLGTGGFATLPGLVLVYYLTDTLGVAALIAGAAVTGAKIWDVVIDPVIGGLSDRAYAKRGSRRGPMLIGIIGLPIFFIATFAVPAGLPPAAAALWVLIAFILASTCFSLFQVPYIALPAELTGSYFARTHLLTWRVVVLTAAILIFGGGGPEIRGLAGDPHLGYLLMALCAGVLLLAGTWAALTIVPQHPAPEAPAASAARVPLFDDYRSGWQVLRDSQPFRALLATFVIQGLTTGLMLAAAQFVARWLLHDEGAVTILFVCLIAPALLVAPVWKAVAGRVGKERAFVIASVLFLTANVSSIPLIWLPGYWIIGPIVLAGAAYAGMQTLPMAMLPDVITVDARTRGDRAGAFGGVWTAGETAGMALGSTLLTLVLAAAGYVSSTAEATAMQPPAALTGIACSFSVIPALLMVLSLVTLSRYRLTQAEVEDD